MYQEKHRPNHYAPRCHPIAKRFNKTKKTEQQIYQQYTLRDNTSRWI